MKIAAAWPHARRALLWEENMKPTQTLRFVVGLLVLAVSLGAQAQQLRVVEESAAASPAPLLNPNAIALLRWYPTG